MSVCEVISGYVLIYQVQQAAPHQLTIYLATRRVAMRDRSRHKRSKVSSNASHNTHIHKYSIQTDYVNVHAHLPSMKTWPVNNPTKGKVPHFLMNYDLVTRISAWPIYYEIECIQHNCQTENTRMWIILACNSILGDFLPTSYQCSTMGDMLSWTRK